MPITIRQVKSRLDSIPIEVAVQEAERIVQARPKLEYVPFFPSEFARRREIDDFKWWSYVPFHGYLILPRTVLSANIIFKVIMLAPTINEADERILLKVGPEVLLTTSNPAQSTLINGTSTHGTITADPTGVSLVVSDLQLARSLTCILMRP